MSFTPILIFFLAGVGLVFAALLMNRLIAPHKPSSEKETTYECGELPVGTPWIRFNTRFYVIALIFLVFDVEVLFLFPWAVNLKELGMFAWLDMAVFIAILAVGLAYVWGKGDLEWVRPRGSSSGGIIAEATRIANMPVQLINRPTETLKTSQPATSNQPTEI